MMKRLKMLDFFGEIFSVIRVIVWGICVVLILDKDKLAVIMYLQVAKKQYFDKLIQNEKTLRPL
ncbi:MAG: hypothetical protein MH472_13655 [Bacteroidia bacterium]|nr:hypothetical protein [Bacteroidia bacterium]